MTDDAKNFCRERGLACQESDGKGPATEQLAHAARRLALLATVDKPLHLQVFSTPT